MAAEVPAEAPGPGRKDAKPVTKEYQSDEFHARLEKLAKALNEEVPDAKYDSKALVQLIVNIAHFQEDALGRNALPPRMMRKLPRKLLEDTAPDGGLFHIARYIAQQRIKRNLKAIDWGAPFLRAQNLGILKGLEGELKKLKLLRTPVIYIHPSMGEEQTQVLRDIARKLEAIVVEEDKPASEITHKLFPYGQKGDPDDGKEYHRVLEFRGRQTKVHWWYLPDSYDEFIPSDVAGKELEPDRQPRGPWCVYMRWLKDSDLYNEWMNPQDYETEEFQAEQDLLLEEEIMKKAGGKEAQEAEQRKRKREQAAAAEEAAAGKRSKAAAAEVDPSVSIPVAAGVVQRQVLHPHQETMEGKTKAQDGSLVPAAAENISYGHQAAGSGVPQAPSSSTAAAAAASGAGPGPGSSAQAPDGPHRPVAARGLPSGSGQEVYTIPAYADWFKFESISETERRLMPNWFAGCNETRNPSMYRDTRNAMVMLYKEDTSRRLTFTAVRQALGGDVNGLLSIYEFLDQWGIINFMAQDNPPDYHLRPAPQAGDGFSMSMRSLPAGPSGLFQFRVPSTKEAAAAARSLPGSMSLLTRKDARGRTPLEPSAPGARFFCNAMPWVDCTALRYHCTKFPDVDLCPQAFAEGRFPPGCTAKDFVRLEARDQPVDADGWTPQETLLLLEGMELHPDNWSASAEHVGTKSQLDCMQHFLSLPIEDTFINVAEAGQGPGQAAATGLCAAADGAAGAKAAAAEAAAGQQDGQPIPFADAQNPVMAQIAFLAMMVGPKVAAAAAQGALASLAEQEALAAGAAGSEGANGAPSSASAADQALQPTAMGLPAAPDLKRPISAAAMKAAAGAALGAATARARLLAQVEEREIQRLVVAAVDTQLKRIELKLKSVEELEQKAESERAAAVAARKRFDEERLVLTQQLPPGAAARLAAATPSVPAGSVPPAAAVRQPAPQQPAVPLPAAVKVEDDGNEDMPDI